MASGRTVHPRPAERKRVACDVRLAPAIVRLLSGDVLHSFVKELDRSRGRVRRLVIVSPWVTDGGDGSVLDRVLRRAAKDQASVVLVTRPPTRAEHAAAIAAVQRSARGRVLLNARLHAKVYLCELGGARGFAVVGSANMTTSSLALDELAVLIRPAPGSHTIFQLAPAAARLAGNQAHRRPTECQRRRTS